MLTLLMPFLKDVHADQPGISSEKDIDYVQYPDPGKPYTCGGTVIFGLERKVVNERS